MNRLVIIGNGFDLAHGLPTSYGHFIDDFWKNIEKNYRTDIIKNVLYVDESHEPFSRLQIKNFDDLKKCLDVYVKSNYVPAYKFDDVNIELNQGAKNIFKFKNDFFKLINIKNSQNWVDIENEYYIELKKIVDDSIKGKQDVLKLNNEFEQVKKLLEDYLKREVNEKFDFLNRLPNIEWSEKHFSPFIKNLNKDQKNSEYLKEFSSHDHKDLINYDDELIDANQKNELDSKIKSGELLQYNYFLNFNYTKTIDVYLNGLKHFFTSKQKQIQIHGRLNDVKNEINFGFGDEMDDHYKKIENINDNEYLKNFKSFQYSQNSNYKELLDFIDSTKFQVYIMGHSCGLSDRTLLNTIFEHKNCRSIKIFYHQKKDKYGNFIMNEKGEITDNFTEIVQNISRHFNKKEMMRERIVNKSLCEPLEQNVRFIKY